MLFAAFLLEFSRVVATAAASVVDKNAGAQFTVHHHALSLFVRGLDWYIYVLNA